MQARAKVITYKEPFYGYNSSGTITDEHLKQGKLLKRQNHKYTDVMSTGGSEKTK
jgi:hypothetical protein